MLFPAGDLLPDYLQIVKNERTPVLIIPFFRGPAKSRTGRDRTGSPLQNSDQLQSLSIFPSPGWPKSTDGNSPHGGICLTPPNDETKSYSGKTKSYSPKNQSISVILPTDYQNVLLCPFQRAIGCRVGLQFLNPEKGGFWIRVRVGYPEECGVILTF
jgi:hypothetical protein